MVATVERPDRLPVEFHPVLDHGILLQARQYHQRVVVSEGLERLRRPAEHSHGALLIRLDPDRGFGPADISKQRAEEERCHRPRFYALQVCWVYRALRCGPAQRPCAPHFILICGG